MLLAIAIVVVIVLTRFSSTNMPELPIPLGLAFLIAGGLAAFLVLIKLLIGDDVVGVRPGPEVRDLPRHARCARSGGRCVLEVQGRRRRDLDRSRLCQRTEHTVLT